MSQSSSLESQPRILVAEDDPFQRFTVCDILAMCGYNIEPAENGVTVMELLNDQYVHYDLVLLDLNMPVSDGWEVLKLMQEDQRLSQIPVVVMSAAKDNAEIADILKMGAINFLEKPLGVSQCKALKGFMKGREHYNEVEVEEQKDGRQFGNGRYVAIKKLGQNTWLVEHKQSEKQYAMKLVQLKNLHGEEKVNVECELEFHKQISGPTIIQLNESFIEEHVLHIVTEYADGGTLTELIQHYKQTNQVFTMDTILMFTAQLSLSLLSLHNHEIIHRDLKPDNILIQGNVLKLTNFRVAKALSGDKLVQQKLGTPYYMSPEVSMNQKYNTKADVWAMGIIIMELINLRKPFESDNVHDLFDRIINQPFESLQNKMPHMNEIIEPLLTKDYKQRPKIQEFIMVPCIQSKLKDFITLNNCGDEVMRLLESNLPCKQQYREAKIENNKKELDEINEYVLDQLSDWVEIIRSEVQVKDYPNGWFGKDVRCVHGDQIHQWMLKRTQIGPRQTGILCQAMVDKGYLENVRNKNERNFQIDHLYRFHMDKEGFPDNQLKTWNEPVTNPVQVSINLVKMITNVYNLAMTDENGLHSEEQILDVDKALKLPEFRAYIHASAELQQVRFENMPNYDRIAFFLNVYQCMYVHNFFEKVIEENRQQQEKPPDGILSHFQQFMAGPSKQFFYNIGGIDFTLSVIKNGLLRNNQKPPNNYKKALNHDDILLRMLNINDPRILFVCLDYPECIELIDSFEGFSDNKLYIDLDSYVATCLDSKIVAIQPDKGIVVIPNIFKIYENDFGGLEKSLRFINKYTEIEYNIQDLLLQIKRGTVKVSYS